MDDLAEKKQAIFESLLDLIKEHGFHGAPMSQVARNAGVAAGTIYHYFESKEQLICELYEYNRARISEVIIKALDGGHTYQEKFFRLWTELYRFYTRHTNVLTFFEQYINSPYNTGGYPRHDRGPLYEFFSGGIRDGVFQSVAPEILMVLVFGTINATAKLHVYGELPIGRAQLEKIAAMMWKGVSAESDSDKKTNTNKPLRTR